ncbi:MAG: response regulator [Candidatus Omnitrophota bacterium]|nr:MAG: response regulator [Candidatus Omnitrophota bacterium]
MNKLLIIDDEIDICETLKGFFEKRGYEVIYALTGSGGMDAFEVEKPSIVILDLYLKDNVSGFEILKEIKAKRPTCGVIVITGSASEDDRRKAMDLGADYYLSKPFSIEVLRNIISKLV